MVRDNKASAVLVSTDIEATQAFYEDKVGLTLSPETIKNHLVFEFGDGTSLLIYFRPAGNQAEHTQVRLWTADVAKDVAELVERGVVFEEYDFENFKTVDHVVIIDRGRLVRAAPLAELSGPPEVAIRTPDATRLHAVLDGAGIATRTEGPDLVVALDATPEAVGRLIAATGLVVYELRLAAGSLEDSFLALTTASKGNR